MKAANRLAVVTLMLTTSAQASVIDGLGVQGGADWSYGSLGDGSSVQNRSVDTLSFRVFPNYDLARAITGLPVPLKLGPIFSYSFVGQLTDSASVNATNMRGHGYKMGVGVGTDFGKIELQAGVNFLGSYSLSNNTSTGQSLSYSGYVGGVLSANYAILPWLAPGIVAEYGGYSKASAGGGASSDVNTLKAWSVGVGVTARYPFASETKKEGEVK